MADCVEAWLDLTQKFPSRRFPDASKAVVDRSSSVFQEPMFLAAHVLHHRFNGNRLSPTQMQSAIEYVVSKLGGRDDINLYLAKQAPFSEAVFQSDVCPVVWWQAGQRMGFPSALVDVAVRLSSTVASSAGLERQFSTLRMTYGLLRTRLVVEKAGKVGFLYRVFNVTDPFDDCHEQ